MKSLIYWLSKFNSDLNVCWRKYGFSYRSFQAACHWKEKLFDGQVSFGFMSWTLNRSLFFPVVTIYILKSHWKLNKLIFRNAHKVILFFSFVGCGKEKLKFRGLVLYFFPSKFEKVYWLYICHTKKAILKINFLHWK